MPKRERYLWVCTNERPPDNPKGSCIGHGSQAVMDELKAGLVKRGLRKRLRVCESSCLDLCWVGAAIGVMPDNVFYGNVRPSDVPEILDALEAGTLVERLLVPDALYDEPKPAGEAK